MQMGASCMKALMPREPGAVGTATCTLWLLESAGAQWGMGERDEGEGRRRGGGGASEGLD